MNNPSSSFIQGINNTVEANKFNPQGLQQEVAQNSRKPIFQQDLVRLISAEIINKQMADTQNSVNLALNPESSTVAEQTFQTTSRNMEAQVAQRVAGVNAVKAAERNKQMNALMGPRGTGIQSLPTNLSMNRSNTASMGGIVGAAMGGHIRGYAQGGVASFDGTDGSVVDGGDEELVEVDNSILEQMLNFGLENPAITAALGVSTWEILKRTPFGRVGKAVVPTSAVNWAKRYIDNFSTMTQTGIGPIAKQTGKGLLNVGKAGILLEGGRQALNTMGGDDTTTTTKPPETTVPPDSNTGASTEEPTDPLTQEELNAIAAEQEALKEQEKRFQENFDTVTNQGVTDRERLALSTTKLADLGQQRIDREREGIADLGTAQETARGAISNAQTEREESEQNYINSIQELADKARGGRREALRDLLYGLSQVSRGSNLGDGLGISAQTMMDREQGREDKAFGIEKEKIGAERGLAALQQQGAITLANMDLGNAKDLTAARNALNATIESVAAATRDSDSQTIKLGMDLNRNTREVLTLMGSNKIEQATVESKAVTAKIAAAQRLLSTAVLKAQGDKFKIEALSGAVSGMSDVITAAKISETLTEEQLASIQNNITAIIGEINKAVGVRPSSTSGAGFTVERVE